MYFNICVSYFYPWCDKMPQRIMLRKGFILTHSLRGKSSSWQGRHGSWGFICGGREGISCFSVATNQETEKMNGWWGVSKITLRCHLPTPSHPVTHFFHPGTTIYRFYNIQNSEPTL